MFPEGVLLPPILTCAAAAQKEEMAAHAQLSLFPSHGDQSTVKYMYILLYSEHSLKKWIEQHRA